MTRKAVDEVRQYTRDHIDAARIDRESRIPDEVVHGLGQVGVLGMCVSPRYGGRGFSQQQYCRVMEVIGAHCGGTTVFVNAHHSIGLRAIELFGTEKTRRNAGYRPLRAEKHWPPSPSPSRRPDRMRRTSARGATPTPDGRGYVLNGTNSTSRTAPFAGMLTVMARTPDPKEPDGKVTAFLVTPDLPGFEVLEARMDKVGIRGTATARLAFNDMFVPKENLLGEYGKGLRLALDRPRLRPHDLRGELHRRRQVLRPRGDAIRQRAAAVRQDACRVRSGPRKDRDCGSRDVRNGNRDLSHGGPDRPGAQVYISNIDDQAVRQRRPVADCERHASNPRRSRILH